MILLVSGYSGEAASLPFAQVGFLVTPKTSYRVERVFAHTRVWACDNDCFKGLDRLAYERMLNRWQGQPGCLWVSAPDVICNAAATLVQFEEWEPVLHARGFPVALVLQDGQETVPVPWDKLEAVFVGGSTRFKLGHVAFDLCVEAKNRGKLVHWGRVNSQRRMEASARAGADSIDGSGYSKWKKLIVPGLAQVQQAERLAREQAELFP